MRRAAERVEAEVQGLTRRLAGRDLRLEGSVRMTAPDDLMAALLMPALARFRRLYPGIRLEAVVDNRLLNLTRREADVAVRPTPAAPESLVGRRLAKVAIAAYANPDHIEAPPAARRPAALAQLPWIGWEEGGGGASLMAWAARHRLNGALAYRTNSLLNQQAACAAGLGVALLPCFLGDPDPDLVRLLPPQEALAVDLWLLTHRDLRRTARVRALLDVLYEDLTSCKALIEGGSVKI